VSKLDPGKYLGEIKGINIAAPSIDGRYLYVADSDLAIVGVVDTREDKVIKTIRVGKDPWRIYMSHEACGITANNGDETISIIDTKSNSVRQRSRPPGHDRSELAGGKPTSSNERFRLRLRHVQPEAGGTHPNRTNIQVRRHTDVQDENLPGRSTNHQVVIIDPRTIDRAREGRWPHPWGTHIMDNKDSYCH
jgi:YVTN family beta-propeller protein